MQLSIKYCPFFVVHNIIELKVINMINPQDLNKLSDVEIAKLCFSNKTWQAFAKDRILSNQGIIHYLFLNALKSRINDQIYPKETNALQDRVQSLERAYSGKLPPLSSQEIHASEEFLIQTLVTLKAHDIQNAVSKDVIVPDGYENFFDKILDKKIEEAMDIIDDGLRFLALQDLALVFIERRDYIRAKTAAHPMDNDLTIDERADCRLKGEKAKELAEENDFNNAFKTAYEINDLRSKAVMLGDIEIYKIIKNHPEEMSTLGDFLKKRLYNQAISYAFNIGHPTVLKNACLGEIALDLLNSDPDRAIEVACLINDIAERDNVLLKMSKMFMLRYKDEGHTQAALKLIKFKEKLIF